MKYILRIFFFCAVASFFFASCGSQKNVIKNQTAAVNYARDHRQTELKELVKEYRTLIRSLDKDEKPAPGLYAEYGLLLFRSGDLKNAEKMLQTEMQHYPESKTYIEAFLNK
ncbi:DUF4810 domain-containing protein [Bacteroidales bacterium OttesenSCG-928-C19]|nr:DUF4810 domain-containing protein [Bacteroidales bacterium OttesenSCG-928-C19]